MILLLAKCGNSGVASETEENTYRGSDSALLEPGMHHFTKATVT